jgi:GAF domain-containing protein
MSATPDRTLANPEQIIADLRRQLAECKAERDEREAELAEAREQQTATAEVLQVINSSPGDLAPVFDAILEKAHILCEAAIGALVVRDGNVFRAVATHGLPEQFDEMLRQPLPVHTTGGLHERLLHGERLIHIADQAATQQTNPWSRASVEIAGTRTLLAIALRKDDALLGYITASRPEVRPFTDKQIALLQNFAAQAVIAMENARLLTETREALDQQTATAGVLQVINSSPGDLTPVFDVMLEKAMRLCEAYFGVLNTYDGERFHRAAARGEPPAHTEWRLHRRAVSGPGTGHARIVAGEDVVHTLDLMAEAAYRDGDPDRRAFVDLAGARTGLIVALRKEDTLLGTIRIYRQEVQPFTDKQIGLLQNFAAQTVIAIDNARLIAETREALEQQTATAEVLQVINSSPGNLAPVFDAMLEKAMRLCGAVHGTLTSYDGEYFRCVANHNLPEPLFELLCKPRRAAPDSPQERLLQGEHIVHIADMRALPWENNEVARAGAEIGFTRTALYVALRKDNILLGYIGAQRNEVRPFTNKQIALLQNFAAQAVIAMENARLITETREALEQQTATAEVLQVINSSPGNLAPVFDAILDKAHAFCAAPLGSLVLCDGEQLRAIATRGYPEQYDTMARQGFPPTRPFELLQSGDPFVHVSDAATLALPRYPTHRAAVEIAGIRTALFVPLRKDAAVLGYISAQRQEVRPFSGKQIALLQNFAAQAVIAMENARLITETREALEQQTATAEVLQVINSSPGDLAPVFHSMLEKAIRLCSGIQGALWTVEGDRARVAASYGNTPEFVALLREHARGAPDPPEAVREIMRGGCVLNIRDLIEHELYQGGDPVAKGAVELSGVRSLVGIPLVKDRASVGAFMIGRREVRAFSEKEIALLQNFAAQAVIAMENARLLTETREALEQQTATAEVLQVINSSPGDLAPVFDAILEKAHTLCEAVHGVLVLLDGENFRAVGARGLPEAFAEQLKKGFPAAGNPVAQPLLDGAPFVQLPDVGQIDNPVSKAGAAIAGLRTLMAVPLRKDDALLGWIVAARREVRPFSDKQIVLLQNFAAQAVIAMENARLITETREALEQQTATAEVLQVINSSFGDLTPVFELMLERAIRLCEAAYGVLWTFNGEGFRAATLHGVPEAYAASLAQEPTQFARGTNTALGQIAEGSDFVHFGDVANEEGYMTSGARRLIELGGARTMMVVALRKDGKLRGAISAFRQEVRPFADQQIGLLQNFAAQAVIAMENARLITETREALEQQTATAEVLGVINSSPGDLTPVFDSMLEKATRLCEAPFGILRTWDGERFHLGAVHGDEPRYRDWAQQRGPIRPDRDASPLGRILAGERIVHFADVPGGEGYLTTSGFRDMVKASGVRSAIWVALRKDDALLGVIIVYRQEVRPFSDKQIALLQNFAAQAVIAMENARLLKETQEALEQQTATAEVLQVINSSPGNLAPVFDVILEKAHTLCGAAHGSLTLAEGERCRAVATRGMPEEFAKVLRQPFDPGHLGDRLWSGEPVQISDIAATSSDSSVHRAAVGPGGVRTLLAVPLRKDGALLGYITANRQEVRPFSDKQIALLQNFAVQAVIAMENARLIGELRDRTDQVAELNRGLEARVAEQVEELGRIGRLKRFLAPQLAELIISQGDEKILESHRRDIVVVFCDLRGYTAFTETAEPEEVLDFLCEYHGALGPLVSQFEGTLDQFSGDGIMVFFNDPIPCPDPAERAVKMAMTMREEASKLITAWRRHGYELGFGAGIAQGYATLGQIGFSERSGYTAIGTVCNLAARLCAEAKDGQILISSRIAEAVEAVAGLEDLGNLELRGLRRPVAAFNVMQSTGANDGSS